MKGIKVELTVGDISITEKKSETVYKAPLTGKTDTTSVKFSIACNNRDILTEQGIVRNGDMVMMTLSRVNRELTDPEFEYEEI